MMIKAFSFLNLSPLKKYLSKMTYAFFEMLLEKSLFPWIDLLRHNAKYTDFLIRKKFMGK